MIADSAAAAIDQLIADDLRFKRTSKGLARSLVWRNGVPPQEMGPNFGHSLTESLQQQADRWVIASLRVIEAQDPARITLARAGFHRAAEAYEAILRNGNDDDPRRPLNRIGSTPRYEAGG